MGADLFGSYVATILASMVLGREIVSDDNFGGIAPVLLPLVIAGLGLVFSIVGTLFVKIKSENGNVQAALNKGNWLSILLTVAASFFVIDFMLPEGELVMSRLNSASFTKMGVFGAVFIGLIVGALMSIITEYYTAMGKGPVNSIINNPLRGMLPILLEAWL